MSNNSKKTLIGSWLFGQALHAVLLYGSKYCSGIAHLVNPKPFSADVQISTKCNSRCITCDYWRSEARKRYPTYDLSIDQIEDIFTQFNEIGIKIVGLGGAEPLIRKDIGELIRKAKEIVGCKVYLTTNGLLLERKAETLLENGIDYLSVSLDGIGGTDEEIRGVPGHYEIAIRGIKKMKRLMETNESGSCECNIGTTILQFNITEIPQLIELASQLGTHWNFNLPDTELASYKNIDFTPLLANNARVIDHTIDYLHKVMEEKQEAFTLDPASLEYARRYLKHKTPYHHCFLGYFRVYVDCELNVYPGCWLLQPVGNLGENRLKTILKSELYRMRVKEMYDVRCPGCTCGYLHNCMIEELPMTIKYLWKRMRTYRKYA